MTRRSFFSTLAAAVVGSRLRSQVYISHIAYLPKGILSSFRDRAQSAVIVSPIIDSRNPADVQRAIDSLVSSLRHQRGVKTSDIRIETTDDQLG